MSHDGMFGPAPTKVTKIPVTNRKTPQTKGEFLDEAKRIIEGDRADTYGDFVELHRKIAKLWGVVLGIHITTEQVLMCMEMVKFGRKVANPDHMDNHIDSMGYAALLAELVESNKK